jgi:hypothetical protein
MDWWDDFINAVGDNYGTGFEGTMGGYQPPYNIPSDVGGASGGYGDYPSPPTEPPSAGNPLTSWLQQNPSQAFNLIKTLGGFMGGQGGAGMPGGYGGYGYGAGMGGGAPGEFNLGSLIPLLGIGSGLNTMFGNKPPAVDPAMVAALWQAGQNTYNTSLDPQNALYDRTVQRLQDQSRASSSAHGAAMGPYAAGLENQAMGNFNIDWNNAQLGRQVQGTQAFSGAGSTAAQAGLANNAQAFMQNQTGLNNLTSGLQGLFGSPTGAPGSIPGATGTQNPIGSWLNTLFSPGPSGGGYTPYDPASAYNSAGTFQPYYTGYDVAGGPAYG